MAQTININDDDSFKLFLNTTDNTLSESNYSTEHGILQHMTLVKVKH